MYLRLKYSKGFIISRCLFCFKQCDSYFSNSENHNGQDSQVLTNSPRPQQSSSPQRD